MTGSLYIGTSGWHYPHWRGTFYPTDLPARDWLAYYAARFATVEINNSFYRVPAATTLRAWAEATPPAFRFAAKASRYLTHMKKLKDPAPALATFLPRIEELDARLGPILFQLPPRWHADPARLEAFLAALPAGHHYAVELRDPTWQTSEILSLLARYRAASCVFDLAGVPSSRALTTDFAYVRLHGPAGRYQGSYSPEALAEWAGLLRAWRADLPAGVYVYFDNDEAGYAARDALALRALIEG